MTAATVERGSGVRLAAFAGLTGLAAWRYAAIETGPPTARILAVAASAVVAAAALMLLRPAAARVLVLAALFIVALLAAGVPAGLLRPARWGVLAHHMNGGLRSLGTTLWPYSGRDGWTRVDILLGLVAVPLGAAALGFWPIASGHKAAALRYRIRQVLALVLLLGLYVVGVVDSGPGSIHRRRPAAAGAGRSVAVAARTEGPRVTRSAGVAGGGRRARRRRRWPARHAPPVVRLPGLGPARAGNPSISFSWDQRYGPITWSRSRQTVFTSPRLAPSCGR